jgi:hypothetical protein
MSRFGFQVFSLERDHVKTNGVPQVSLGVKIASLNLDMIFDIIFDMKIFIRII